MSAVAYDLVEGDWFVRGTLDVEEAKAALADHELIYDDAPQDEDWEVVLVDPRPGLWRFVPCSPKSCGEHGWHLVGAKAAGRGVFPGIFTGAYAEAVEFDCDDPWPEEA